MSSATGAALVRKFMRKIAQRRGDWLGERSFLLHRAVMLSAEDAC